MFDRIEARVHARTRTREYQTVLRSARLLGSDAGLEWFCMSHEDDPPPKTPDARLWREWDPKAPAQVRRHVLSFNAQMAYAEGRVAGYAQAFLADMNFSVASALEGGR